MKSRRPAIVMIQSGIVSGLAASVAGCKPERELRREEVAERGVTYTEYMNALRFESAAKLTTPEDQAAAAEMEDVSG